MYVFNYDQTTLAYTGGTPCDFDQKRPGEVLVPAWATKTPPPRDWDNAVNWPHYLPATDDWELRPLPAPVPVAEPEPPTQVEVIDNLQARIDAHLREAQRLLELAKKETEAGA